MANNIAANRLRKELAKLKKDPPPGIIAEPKESDVLTWFYAIQGPPDTPYEGGIYVGKIKFPSEYPMKPPGILMLTPSGRFEVNTRLCMSMSDFHPESWNPMWSVSTILQGVVSFMTSEELTTGGIKAPDRERKRLAGLSKAYNTKNNFDKLFDGDMEAAFAEAEQARQAAEKANAVAAAAAQTNGSSRGGVRARRRAGPRKTRQNTTRSATQNEQEEYEEEEEREENDESEQQQQQQEDDDNQETELSPEEIEKRQKKNAKKRAKQKAKKAAAKVDNNNDKEEENGAS